jgi:malonyl-CoA/methylmalonyl-CoA synthetase
VPSAGARVTAGGRQLSAMSNANLYALIEQRMPADRSAACLRVPGGRDLTWQELHQGAGRMAELLAAHGLPAGARLVAQVDKSPQALMLYLATLRSGLVYVPLNVAYQEAELRCFLADAQPAVAVCSPQRLTLFSTLAPDAVCFSLDEHGHGTLTQACDSFGGEFATLQREPDQPAAIVYTSGTTGRSKGAVLSHGNLAHNAIVLDEYWGFRQRREQGGRDVLLHALPLFHVHGLFVACHAALFSGATMIFLPRFEVGEIVRELRNATVMMGVPTFYTRLLQEPSFDRGQCAPLRLFISGSAPLLRETFDEFRRRTGHTLLERYGMSETLMLASNPYFGDPERDRIAGTVGPALPGVHIRIARADGTPAAAAEVGMVEVRGPNVFSGYWRQPQRKREDFTADGYFRTGDLGCLGSAGAPPDYLKLVGRAKDLIITGGYNVYPKEVEGYLDELPGVVESAVVGLPHPDFGEAVCAFVVMEPSSDLDAAQIIASLKGRIAGFKVPKRIWQLPELPRNAMGKVQKNLLREHYAKTFSGS